MSQDASTVSGDSSHADICPSKFDNDSIDVSGVPVLVSWVASRQSPNTRPYLCHSSHDHLTLHIHRDASSSTAFFQLKANIALKARRDRTNVYLYIYPEQVQTVALLENDASQDVAASKLGTSTCCLQFAMAASPALIVPQGDLTPKHKNAGLVLDSLQALAKQTSFGVHLPAATLTKARLLSLCESVSAGKLRSSPRFADTVSLYGGKGARVIQHVHETAVASGSAASVVAQCPPSYDESAMGSPPPRLHASQDSGVKRRRVDASDGDYSDKVHHRASMTVQMMCEKMMERIETGFNEVGCRLDRMEQRLTDLEASVEHHAEKLETSIVNVRHRSSEQVDELRDELDTRLCDVRKETEDVISIRVEDEMFVAREQLEDFVKDEMANVEESIEDKIEASLSNANVALDFSWNR